MSNAIARKLSVIQEKGAMRSVDVANLLNARPETVSRWNQGKAFPRPDAEKLLLQLEFIIDQLSDIYEPQEARMWLYSPQRLLGNRSPAELIQEGRSQEVIVVVNQLRDSVHI
ncbi:antitoxin Xre/MbcA/ParS toxin-binding domain-containing protein [Methylosinus sp. KRF6]|uniref:antitoxin Xre/MbcA/ParS toxin-binding domain-containing protein n=1 Tax=Methylosinus sp. KRF6 TaxID=2846853 RepID=UPI001C0CDE45|nr:antitoxin Xre/MbcA/ParS toxin-binding domain-containing protein [Methylosinus sp. KRF6]MBU3887640.1 MbcA/ParS/Xre antitoxin family protein [Methylosinus sp. KRF6]